MNDHTYYLKQERAATLKIKKRSETKLGQATRENKYKTQVWSLLNVSSWIGN